MIDAIHIEDEPGIIELLKSMVKTYCGGTVRMVGSAKNAGDAIALIREKKPQLVYLDIELNQGNAFELLEQLNQQYELDFQVIFITAFNEYAVKAFRHNAADYLLKPISITELKEATARALEKIRLSSGNDHIIEVMKQLKVNFGSHRIGLPVADGVIFINAEEIIRAEAKGSYSTVYLKHGKTLTISKNLKDIELILPENYFFRVHHSWIINIKYLKKYYRGKNSYMEMDDGSTVLVSIRKKSKFLDFIQ